MSEEPSPHAPQAMPPVMPPFPVAPVPGQIKVLGIMHLVVAGIGLLIAIFGWAVKAFTRNAMSGQARMTGMDGTQARMQLDLQALTANTDLFQAAMTLVLTVMLVVAGVGLLKQQRRGIQMSNVYAITSILSKMILIVMLAVWVKPGMDAVMNKMVTELMAATPGGGGGASRVPGPGVPSMMSTWMKVWMSIVLFGTPLIYCIYPIVVLFLLNRASVRNALR